MGDGFRDACDAAADRLEALIGNGDEDATFDMEDMRLLFVGLDVDRDSYRDIAHTIEAEYGTPVIETLAEALEADHDRFALGYIVGRRLSEALRGAFTLGVLIGELHRESTIKREATSDDDREDTP
jgi:hypothetical protein